MIARIRFKGQMALFTHPALRSERMSYPFLTPSGAKGALRSLYWKPEFEWVVLRIYILRPIQRTYFAVKELSSNSGSVIVGNLALKDVEYLVEAMPVPNPLRDPDPAKINGEVARRLRKGESWRTPYLGVSDCPALWEWVDPETVVTPEPINMTVEGFLWDLVPVDIHADRFNPVFHTATVVNGVYTAPPELWQQHRDQFFQARHKAHPNRKGSNKSC